MLKYLIRKITKTPVGLKSLPTDNRDLGFELIFGLGYQPLYTEKYIPHFSIKNQKYNTCGWASLTGAKEIDEQVKLSERVAVMLGRREGYISGDGFSNLRDNEKVALKFGIAEDRFNLPEYKSWNEYSNPDYLTDEMLASAKEHRSKIYIRAYTLGGIYKALDEERPVRIGVSWRTSMNMNGGFSFPWLLNFLKGILVGGHAVYLTGYNLKFKDSRQNEVTAFRGINSFGEDYGDKGKFNIKAEDLEREIKKYGAYFNYDMDVDYARWLQDNQGKVVKTNDNKDIYLIQADKKRKYDDELTLMAHGKAINDIIVVEKSILDKIEQGDDIHFWDGGNVKQVKEFARMLSDNSPSLLDQFKAYFKELF